MGEMASFRLWYIVSDAILWGMRRVAFRRRKINWIARQMLCIAEIPLVASPHDTTRHAI